MKTRYKVLLGVFVWPLGIYWAFKGAGASRVASIVIASVTGVLLLGITIAAASGGGSNGTKPSAEAPTTTSGIKTASAVEQKSLQQANAQLQRLRLRVARYDTDLHYAIRQWNRLKRANASLHTSVVSLKADLANARATADASYKDGYAKGYSDGASSSGGGTETAGCDPNYEGACVPDTGYDVDCADVAATDFSVVGDDVDGLDGDGDGIACESY